MTPRADIIRHFSHTHANTHTLLSHPRDVIVYYALSLTLSFSHFNGTFISFTVAVHFTPDGSGSNNSWKKLIECERDSSHGASFWVCFQFSSIFTFARTSHKNLQSNRNLRLFLSSTCRNRHGNVQSVIVINKGANISGNCIVIVPIDIHYSKFKQKQQNAQGMCVWVCSCRMFFVFHAHWISLKKSVSFIRINKSSINHWKPHSI